MTGTEFLTLFLFLGGAFTVWCCIKDYDWYFKYGGFSLFFIDGPWRQVARIIYGFFGLVMLTWGTARLVDPPPVIPTEFIFELGKPYGIDLIPAEDSLEQLRGKSVFNLKEDDKGWTSFWVPLEKDDPNYQSAALAAKAGPDFAEGFHRSSCSPGGQPVEGRIIYFDSGLQSCDNMLFSKKPLSTAAFVMVICTEEVSAGYKETEGLVVHFFRAETPPFQTATYY